MHVVSAWTQFNQTKEQGELRIRVYVPISVKLRIYTFILNTGFLSPVIFFIGIKLWTALALYFFLLLSLDGFCRLNSWFWSFHIQPSYLFHLFIDILDQTKQLATTTQQHLLSNIWILWHYRADRMQTGSWTRGEITFRAWSLSGTSWLYAFLFISAVLYHPPQSSCFPRLRKQHEQKLYNGFFWKSHK